MAIKIKNPSEINQKGLSNIEKTISVELAAVSQ